jgi:hypothetical protein
MIKRKYIFLIICQILLTFMLLEGFFRWYYYRWNTNQSVPFILFNRAYPGSDNLKNFITPSSYDGIIYELKPNLRTELFNKPFNTNSQGELGTKEYSKDKSENIIRIIGVGDSVMSSWGNNPEDTYLEGLGRSLQNYASPMDIETINMSVPGYNTAIENSVIKEKALAYNPDLIIIGFVGNDMDLPNFIRKEVHAISYAYFVLKQTFDYIYFQYNHKFDNNIVSTDQLSDSSVSPFTMLDGSTVLRFQWDVGQVPEKYRYMVGWDNFLKQMKEISDIGNKNNIPILLLIDLRFLDKLPELESLGFHILIIDQKVDDYLKNHNLTNKDIQLNSDDHHLNKLGHSIYSQIIYDYIMSDIELKKIFKN